jgi:hypothetical protein
VRRDRLLLLPALLAVGLLAAWLLRHRDEAPVSPVEAPAPPEGTAGPAPEAPAPGPDRPAPVRDGLPIAGRVRTEEGEAVPRADVLAVGTQDVPSDRRIHRTTTDDEGRFRFEGLVPGPWGVSVHAAGLRPGSARDVAAGTTDLQIALGPLGWIEATVLGPDGSPWGGDVEVVVTFVGFEAGGAPAESVPGGPVRTVSGAAPGGLHRVRGIPAGLWRVEATARGEPPLVSSGPGVDATVVEGRPTPATVRLVRAGRMEGTVVDAVTGAASASELRFRLESRPASAGATSAPPRVTQTGAWEVDGLAAGTWAVVGRAASGGWVRERIEVGVGQVVRKDLVVQPSGSVRVHLVHDDGTPAGTVRVVLATEDGLWRQPDPAGKEAGDLTWLSDAQGWHRRDGIPSGRLRVSTLPDARHGPATETAVEVPPGGNVEVEVVVPRAPRAVR